MTTVPPNLLRDPRSIERLTDAQIAACSSAFMPKLTKYIPHVPHARQWAFLLLNCREALFGGAAGGGKSDALLMAALQYVDVPGYSALLLRRTYTDLTKPGCLIPRSNEWLRHTDAHWNGNDKCWTFPSGAKLSFGYLDNERDQYRYQSAEYQFIGFDELTNFPLEDWYLYLFSRLRATVGRLDSVPLRMRAGTNPGGLGEEWVGRRFIQEGAQYGRVFVKSLLEDNPSLQQEDYDDSLRKLNPTTYEQLRRGVWGVKAPGNFFRKADFEILDAAPAGVRWHRSWDLAATDSKTACYTAGAKVGLLDGTFYIGDMVRIKGDPGVVERTVVQTAQVDNRNVQIIMEQEGGSGGVQAMYRYSKLLAGWVFTPYHPRMDKLTRATPLASASRAHNVKLINGPWIGACLNEFEAFPTGFKDQVDACSSAYQLLTTRPEPHIRRLY